MHRESTILPDGVEGKRNLKDTLVSWAKAQSTVDGSAGLSEVARGPSINDVTHQGGQTFCDDVWRGGRGVLKMWRHIIVLLLNLLTRVKLFNNKQQ